MGDREPIPPNGDSRGEGASSAGAPRLRPERPSAILVVVPVLVVLITFLFWYETWFGRPLDDAEMDQYLTDVSRPHDTQHALSLLSDRIARGDPKARRWYPEVIRLAASPQAGFRMMAAWTMGQDNHSERFHEALRKLTADSDPMVRWNATLALVRFGDPSAEPLLRQMLRPYDVPAPVAGTVAFDVKVQEKVRRGSRVARVVKQGSGDTPVTSPLDGSMTRIDVPDGAPVAAGEPIASIAPGEDQVWESLRALSLLGTPGDLADIERFASGAPGMPDRVRDQAEAAIQAIRERADAKAAGGK